MLPFFIPVENRYLKVIMEARNPNANAGGNEALILLDDKVITNAPAACASLVTAYEDIL